MAALLNGLFLSEGRPANPHRPILSADSISSQHTSTPGQLVPPVVTLAGMVHYMFRFATGESLSCRYCCCSLILSCNPDLSVFLPRISIFFLPFHQNIFLKEISNTPVCSEEEETDPQSRCRMTSYPPLLHRHCPSSFVRVYVDCNWLMKCPSRKVCLLPSIPLPPSPRPQKAAILWIDI